MGKRKSNRFLTLLVALSILFGGISSALGAVEVTVGSVTATPGLKNVTVDVTVNAESPAIRKVAVYIKYDLNVVENVKGTKVDGEWLIAPITTNATTGEVTIALGGAADALPASKAATLARLTFDIKSTAVAGSSVLEYLSKSTLTDNNNNPITATGINGKVTVEVKAKVTASVTGTGGTIAPTEATEYPVGQKVDYTLTPDENYEVDTFKVDGADAKAALVNNVYSFAAIVAGDHTVAVTFKEKAKVEITATAGEGGTITPSGKSSYYVGTQPLYRVTVNEGYEVSTVTVGGQTAALDQNNEYKFPALTATATTINVSFKKIQYTVKASVNDAKGGSIDPSGDVKVDYGTEKTFTVTVNRGWKVKTFTVTGDTAAALVNNAYTLKAVKADATITVTFEEVKEFTIKVSLNPVAGGTVTPAPDANGEVKVQPGANATFTVKANTGYQVSTVKMDGFNAPLVATGIYAFPKVINEDGHTFDVTFIPAKMWKVNASATPAEGGIIDPKGVVEVAEGGSQAYTLKITAGWLLDKVTVNGVVKEVTGTTFTVADIKEATTVVVTFKKDGKYSSADTNYDYDINLTELMRVSQLYNAGSYSCKPGTEDGYAPGAGDPTCTTKHTSDYDNAATGSKADWKIELSEFLRLIQFYNVGGYRVADKTEDGFVPSAAK